MIEVLILKIENPSCFWVHLKGGGKFLDNEAEYKKLQADMNLFYNKSYRYVDEVKPSVLEEGQVCAIYCQELKSWCRAIIKTIISSTDYLIECFLVDYAKRVPMKADRICVALESFMRLPYRAKKFRLHSTKPVTLRVNYCSDNAETVPANKWDIAAIQYFQNLLNATTQVEAKLCGVEEDSFDVYLYVTINGEKVCVNDELVAKNFAYYEMMEDETLSTVEEQKKHPSFRPESLLEEINPALILWPMLLKAEESKGSETSAGASGYIENATCNNLHEAASHNEEIESEIMVAVAPLKKGITVSVQADVQTDSRLSTKATKIQEEMEKGLEKNISVKLLQFLNPELLKAVDRQDEAEEFQLNVSAHPPVVLRNVIEPCLSLETAPLFPALKKELLRNQFLGPNHSQSYCWPPIARGYDSVVISPENDPLLYLPPIITFLQSRSCYVSLPARNGPLASVICSGQKKAEQVFELLEIYSRCSRPLHPILLLLGMNKEDIKNVRLPRGCEVIVTTPHSLLRLLECHSLLFLRICHLVFDEVEVLFSNASEQMFHILEYYKNTLSAEEKESAPQQIVAVGNHWNKNVEFLTKNFMNDPYVVITSMEEAAIYGNVQQVVQVCLECDRIATLLQILDFTPTDAQKTLIFTSSVEETDIVYKAVESTSIFCFKIHPGIGVHFYYILEQWNKRFSSGTHVVLVLTDDCLPALGITDGTRVVHFSFPTTPRIFGARLYSMSANFQNSVEKVAFLEHGLSKAKSILLLTEKSACHAAGVLRYLERTEAKIPPELCDFTAGVLQAKEDIKSRRPLCQYLKRYGICLWGKHCPDRHRINLKTDFPRKLSEETLPTTGNVTILPLFIVDATNYFGRIVGKQKDQYIALAEEMKEYYKKSCNCVCVDTVKKLAIYALHEENTFHRIQVLEVASKEESCVFYSVQVKYIDEGRAAQVQNYKLLYLPERFQALPPQAVEFIVCRVKPIDNEMEWNPKVTRYINQKIRGKPHEAKIVLTLGNTVWVDPVVRITRLLDLKTSINEYSIRTVILSTGMGVDNPEHTQELQRLFREAEVALEKKDLPALIHPMKCGISDQTTSVSQSILDQTMLNSESIQEQVTSNMQGTKENDSIINDSALQNPSDDVTKSRGAEESLQLCNTCPSTAISQMFPGGSQADHDGDRHLQVLASSPGNQSACAGDKFYLADMELQENILKEKSSCILKNGEPMIIAEKEKKEPWSNLLKHKNPNVSFDFDHFEDSEEKGPFPAATAPKKVHQVATMAYEEMEDCSEDIDSESDDSSDS